MQLMVLLSKLDITIVYQNETVFVNRRKGLPVYFVLCFFCKLIKLINKFLIFLILL